ncbi:OmpA family protein [Actinomyces ruminicola]|uniref:OmpA family protein n=1 Tax=Actinomyces ruminicola TaxID=332524 RepID=UPI00210EBAEF|nr:OmpA family protein [Actinomyces ruminicola]
MAAVLAACADDGGSVTDASAVPSGSASGGATASANSDPVVLKSVWMGEALTTRVGPAVVKGDHTVVRVVVSTDAEGAVDLYGMFGPHTAAATLNAVRLLSLIQGFALREVTRGGGNESVEPGGSVELFPVFGRLPDGVASVDVFLPNVGVALGVPVMDAGAAAFDVEAALADAEIDESIKSGPFDLNSVVVADDGSSDTEKDEASTTVNVSGDVLFATDSADLSGEADGVLGSVVEQLELYPSGGQLAITGHTDDVNTDEHNQDLSERRAKAVLDRLGELADLSGWEVSVSGKGESEPRVANDSDENRQLNRRVEIVLTPTDPGEASTATSDVSALGSSGEMPEPKGPVGRGPDGVAIEVDGVPARISLDSVTRIGDYLTGTIKIVAERDASVSISYFGVPTSMYSLREWGTYQSTGFSLLKGGSRYLLADFTDGEGVNRPLTNFWRNRLEANVAQSLPVVWPDTGEDTITVDAPGGKSLGRPVLAVRLTDIPVVEA